MFRRQAAVQAEVQAAAMRAVEFAENVADDPQIGEGEVRSALRGLGEMLDQMRDLQAHQHMALQNARLNSLMMFLVLVVSIVFERIT